MHAYENQHFFHTLFSLKVWLHESVYEYYKDNSMICCVNQTQNVYMEELALQQRYIAHLNIIKITVIPLSIKFLTLKN